MLKVAGMRLEEIMDIDIYLFIEKGLRGGISYIAKRYAKASNKYIKDYDLKKASEFITYLDINNFYDWEMSIYLPSGRFKWLKNVDGFDVNSISEQSPKGYILEVDLGGPDKLHVLHYGYPLASEKLAIPYEILSDYCKKTAKNLLPNLGNKTNYVVHYKNLQLYWSIGMKLTKIHTGLKFKQSDWMKKYFDFNTKKAANSFEKDFFKIDD